MKRQEHREFRERARRNVEKKRIVRLPFYRKANYLEARRLTERKGGLPSNVLHDDYLVVTSEHNHIHIQKLYPAWAREILVYPEKGGKFKKGKDVVDSETGWVFPVGYIPEEAVGREKVGLFVDPKNIEEEDGKVIVHPQTVKVLHPLGRSGIPDEETRMPLENELFKQLLEEFGRWLHSRGGPGVRPLARDKGKLRKLVRVITASHPNKERGVSFVSVLEDGEGMPLKTGLEEFKVLVIEALVNVDKLAEDILYSDVVRRGKMDAILQLMSSLRAEIDDKELRNYREHIPKK